MKLELLTDLVINDKKGIRDGITREIHRYAKANNKYKTNYDKNKEWKQFIWMGNVSKTACRWF